MVETVVIIVIVPVSLAIALMAQSVRLVPRQWAYVILRFGKYHRTLGAGLHFVIPFIEGIRKYSLHEHVLDIPAQACLTEDNILVDITAVLFFKVTMPEKTTYDQSKIMPAMTQLAQTTLQSEVAKIPLTTFWNERSRFEDKIFQALSVITATFGITVVRFIIFCAVGCFAP
jgi:regulator of protease activity HflC (stomatin/prohibitin superfamily)